MASSAHLTRRARSVKHGQTLTKSQKAKQEKVKRRDILIALASDECHDCGEQHPNWMYDFHHVRPAKKKFKLSGGNLLKRWELVMAEFKKCVILCPNCHRIRHAKMEGWV